MTKRSLLSERPSYLDGSCCHTQGCVETCYMYSVCRWSINNNSDHCHNVEYVFGPLIFYVPLVFILLCIYSLTNNTCTEVVIILKMYDDLECTTQNGKFQHQMWWNVQQSRSSIHQWFWCRGNLHRTLEVLLIITRWLQSRWMKRVWRMKPTCTTQQVRDTTSNWNFQSIYIVGFLFFKFLWLYRCHVCRTNPQYMSVHVLWSASSVDERHSVRYTEFISYLEFLSPLHLWSMCMFGRMKMA